MALVSVSLAARKNLIIGLIDYFQSGVSKIVRFLTQTDQLFHSRSA
jgi:hypothetical protein